MSKEFALYSEYQRKLTQSRYDRLSKIYNLLTGNWEEKPRSIGITRLDCQPGHKVLEIGPGTGRALPILANAVSSGGMIIGLDLANGMLSVAQSFVKHTISVGNIHLVGGDACRIPFQNGFFDAIFISFTLELFSDDEIPVVLSECSRVLSTGGRICVVSLSKIGKDTLIRNLYEWFHHKIPQWVDCRPIYVETAMRQAGFEVFLVNLYSLIGLPVEIVSAVKP